MVVADWIEHAKWAIAGAVALFGTAFGFIMRRINGVEKTDAAGRAEIWKRIDGHIDHDADAHRQFATREDISELRSHIDTRFGEVIDVLKLRRD